jgi:phosphate uptake regulator
MNFDVGSVFDAFIWTLGYNVAMKITRTSLSVREDRPTSISSQLKNANISALGFNIVLIALKQPVLAIKIMELYNEARKIDIDDPAALDEDYKLALEKLAELMKPKP